MKGYTQEIFKVVNYSDLPEEICDHILDRGINDSLYRFYLDWYYQTEYNLDDEYERMNRDTYNYFVQLGISESDNVLIEMNY